MRWMQNLNNVRTILIVAFILLLTAGLDYKYFEWKTLRTSFKTQSHPSITKTIFCFLSPPLINQPSHADNNAGQKHKGSERRDGFVIAEVDSPKAFKPGVCPLHHVSLPA